MPQDGKVLYMIKIHFSYRHVEKPWGGANNFIRALRGRMEADGGYLFMENIEDKCDVMFMNQLGTGPGNGRGVHRLSDVRRVIGGDGRKLIVRAVNLNRHAFPMGPRNIMFGTLEDLTTISLLNLADKVIFQSAYQASVFTAAGYRGGSAQVVHNGADLSFWNDGAPMKLGSGVLRIVSATASDRATKRHDLIARVSLLQGVEVLHCGAWPKGVNPGNVRLLGTLTRFEMAKLYAEAHLFMHPAVKDPCPNAIFEAVCAGLPVLYNPGPGSSLEIVGQCGIALDEDALERTLHEARQRLENLHEIVRDRRAYYRIDRAVADYAAVFSDLHSSNQREGSRHDF
jgi:glycosyltransferase involved in cell wall biosynthesis